MLGLLGFCHACGSLQAQNPNPQTSTSPTSSATTVVALGKMIPEGDVSKISVVNAQDSRVNQMLVKEGDFVEANQVIAVLQGQDRVEQQLRDAEANVATRQAQLRKIRQGEAKPGDLTAQKAVITELEARLRTETTQKTAAIAEAAATLNNTQQQYQRNLSLWQEGAGNRATVDDAQANFDKAKAAHDRTKADLDSTTSTLQAQIAKERANLDRLQEVRPVDIEIAESELAQALVQVQQRKAELRDTQVRVPVGGQILRINTRVGEKVNTEAGIVELGRTQQMFVVAEVYETDIVRVKKGQQAVITSEYGGFRDEVKGTVDQIGFQIGKTQFEDKSTTKPTTDINTRVVQVTIRLTPEDSAKVATLTGMRVRVRIDAKS